LDWPTQYIDKKRFGPDQRSEFSYRYLQREREFVTALVLGNALEPQTREQGS